MFPIAHYIKEIMLKGRQLYHNYVRPHEALKGKTSAEACGIIIEGQDKWKTLVQNACKNLKSVFLGFSKQALNWLRMHREQGAGN